MYSITFSKQFLSKSILYVITFCGLFFGISALAANQSVGANGQVMVSVDQAEVALTFTLGTPCSPYLIKWGDGQQTQQVRDTDMACIQVLHELTKRHTYAEPGTYDITLTLGSKQFDRTVTIDEAASSSSPERNPSGQGAETAATSTDNTVARVGLQEKIIDLLKQLIALLQF